MSDIPLAIKPIYQTLNINQEITLHMGAIEVTDHKFEPSHTCECSIVRSSESLELPFPGFYDRLQSAIWSDPIRRPLPGTLNVIEERAA